MKKVMMVALGVLVLAITASVWAADDTTKAADPQKQVRPDRPRPPMTDEQMEMRHQMRERGMQGMPGRDPNMVREAVERRSQMHQQMIKELEAIKAIAQSENATKTVEAIQKLIDSRNAEFKKQTEEMEKRRAEMMERMEQRRQQGGPRPRPERPQAPRSPEQQD